MSIPSPLRICFDSDAASADVLRGDPFYALGEVGCAALLLF